GIDIMTAFGKLLVLLVLIGSLAVLSWSVIVHYDSTDWGWNEKAARKEFGQPVPSELKKAQTSLKHAQESLDLEMTNYKVGRAQLAPLEPKVAEQQQDFARYFTYLEKGPNPEVKGSAPIVRRLRFDKGFGLLPGVEW